jgi:hypothetical protein
MKSLDERAAELILLMRHRDEVEIQQNRSHFTVGWAGFLGFGHSLCAAVLDLLARRRRWFALRPA